MARKTKEEAERTYHALLDAATVLFTQKGVSNTTLNDIASQAGMTRGAIYWHFNDKDNIIMALWERNASKTHQEFLDQLQHLSPEDPANEFHALINGIIQRIASKPQLAQIMRILMNNVELTDEQTELQGFMQNKKELLRTALTNALEFLSLNHSLKTHVPPAIVAQGLMAYMHGLIHAYLEPGHQYLDLKQDGDTLLGLYLDTILV